MKIFNCIAIAMMFLFAGAAKANMCMLDNESPTSCSKYTYAHNGETQGATGTWMVWDCAGGSVSRFAGMSYCSEISGTYAAQGDPGTSGTHAFHDDSAASGDHYCWCAITSPALSGWVFQDGYSTAANCSRNCANCCASGAAHDSGFRSALFWAIGA